MVLKSETNTKIDGFRQEVRRFYFLLLHDALFTKTLPANRNCAIIHIGGDDAREAFDKANKRGACCIEWFKDKHTKDLPDNLNTAKALDELVEVYVVEKDFEWTYIKTHEFMPSVDKEVFL